MRDKYIVSQLNETQLKNIDKYMRDKLAVPYESIEWNKVYGVYYVETNKRCELMPDCYSDEGFSGSASGFNTGNYDKAVDGLTELYKSGEKVSFKWFGGNLYCCPENAASYPIEWQVFHKPSVVYLYEAENGARIVRNIIGNL